MRAFDHFNDSHGAVCPICNTARDEKTVLIPVPGTEDDGIVEARQVHKECYDVVANWPGAER